MATVVDTSRETVSLIGSDKVDGTAVYGADDRKIGSVQRGVYGNVRHTGSLRACAVPHLENRVQMSFDGAFSHA
jgi:hypothetical protein